MRLSTALTTLLQAFLRQFRRASVELHKLPQRPHQSEITARFLRHSNHLNRKGDGINGRAYEPSRVSLRASVFRTPGLVEEQIWYLAASHVLSSKTPKIYGRADLSVSHVRRAGLQCISSEPPVRHANIEGWPSEKDAYMSKAQELAAEATVFKKEMSL